MFQYFYPYRAQATRHIIPRAPLRLPWAMNFCLFEAYPSDRMSSPVMWHTTSSYFPPAKNPWRSAAPTARSVLLTSSPHGICAYLRDPWENKKHPACSLAHCALSCRPQISRISTDFSHTKQAHRVTFSHTTLRLRKNPWQSVAPAAHQNQAVGSGARVKNP